MATEAGKLKPGSYVVIDGEPCRVVSMIKSKPGKHGSTKARVAGVGIFDGKKRELMRPASSTVEVPMIEKKKAQVLSVEGNIAQLMDLTEYNNFEATIPEEFEGKIEAGGEVSYWKIGERVLIKEVSGP
ncbi:MAG: translation initiation factor IF-5A [Candidatus Aenigmarchaeota archaeon]